MQNFKLLNDAVAVLKISNHLPCVYTAIKENIVSVDGTELNLSAIAVANNYQQAQFHKHVQQLCKYGFLQCANKKYTAKQIKFPYALEQQLHNMTKDELVQLLLLYDKIHS